MEKPVRAELHEEQSWSERAEIAIATISAYRDESFPKEPQAAVVAARELGRVGSASFLAACLLAELGWLMAIVYLVLRVT